MSSLSRRLETALAAVVWTILVTTLAVAVLTVPAVTGTLVSWLDASERTSLPRAQTRQTAELVRDFVTSERAEDLPRTIGDRDAFDQRAVSHLLDVRSALRAGRLATGAAALALAVWIGIGAARKRWDALARGIEAGGWVTLVFVLAAGLFMALGFDRAFEQFHGLLFEEGTWIFPADSLLIQLFPEPFWVAMGGLLAGLCGLGGAVLVVAGRRVKARSSN